MTTSNHQQPLQVGDKVTWISQVTRYGSHGTYIQFTTVSGKILSLRGETALLKGRAGLTLLNVAFLTPANKPSELTKVVMAHGA